ncbi:MAG: four helix bundle protein [Bacteroidetes bacterium]|nr:four helix bundle protein [Bacteroidota bacterium]
MKDFRNLEVWRKSHQTVLGVYKSTQSFPKEELFGLTSQIRRAAVSIPSNIAEGCGRGSDAELARFAEIAMGSASELEYQVLLARGLNYLNNEEYEDLSNRIVEVKKMLTSLIKKLSRSVIRFTFLNDAGSRKAGNADR